MKPGDLVQICGREVWGPLHVYKEIFDMDSPSGPPRTSSPAYGFSFRIFGHPGMWMTVHFDVPVGTPAIFLASLCNSDEDWAKLFINGEEAWIKQEFIKGLV